MKIRATIAQWWFLALASLCICITFWTIQDNTSSFLTHMHALLLTVTDKYAVQHAEDDNKRLPFLPLERDFSHFKLTPNNTNMTKVNQGVTSAIYSTYEVVYHAQNSAERIVKGELLHLRIQARDNQNRTITIGGDFWSATINAEDNSASTSGRVVDYHNGTYSVYFYAGWSGTAYVDIHLVHPSNAVTFLRDTFVNIGPKIFWNGEFKVHKELEKAETTLCCIVRMNSSAIFSCEYPTPNALGNYTFACKPGFTRTKCPQLHEIWINPGEIDKATAEVVGNQSLDFESRFFNGVLRRGPKTIDIVDNSNITEAVITSLLPECHPDQPTPISHGYWVEDDWTSLICNTCQWRNASQVQDCLRHKELLLLGDSTTRQWAENMPILLNVTNARPRNAKTEYHYFFRQYEPFNVTVSFKFHPFPVTVTRTPVMLHEVDIIDSITPDNCQNIILVLSPWAHFTQWTRDSYREMLTLIRKSVDRLKIRCPTVPIVVKGPHPREHNNQLSRIYASDFLLQQIGKEMKEIFDGSGVWFLDVWDMNMSYPSKNTVHMPKTVVQQELFMFLSYVCKER